MKKLFVLIVVLSLASFGMRMDAQGLLNLGLKGGVNLSDYTGDMVDNDMKVGYNVGVTVDYRLSRSFYLLSGVEVSSKGTRVEGSAPVLISRELNPTDEGIYFKQTWNPIYLQVPLHVGYVVSAAENMNILFHIGPYVSYGIGGKVRSKQTIAELEGILQDEKINAFGKGGLLKRWDVGLGLGAGFEFKGVGINLGYDLGLLKAHRSGFKIKNNTAHISITYKFISI